jgi:hypothetical protein
VHEAAPEALRGRRLRVLGEAVVVIEQLLGEDLEPGREEEHLCRQFLAWCEHSAAAEAVVAAAERGSNVDPAWLTPLLRATGRPGAEAILSRLSRASDRAAAERLVVAALGLPDRLLSGVILPRLLGDATLAAAVLGVLAHARVAHRRGLADVLATHPSAEVRAAAMRLLFAEAPDVAAVDRLVGRALDDRAPEIVELGLEQALARATRGSMHLVALFLARLDVPPFADVQRRAAAALVLDGTAQAGDVLATALAARRYGFRKPVRHVSRVIEAALRRFPNHDRALREWRRSPAALLSRMLDRHREGA